MQRDTAQRRMAVVLGLLTGACSSNSNDPNQPSAGPSVEVKNFAFDPDSLQTPVNTTVTWTWNSGGTRHTVTFDDGERSDTMGSGSYTRTFTAPGSYRYHCAIHPVQMQGVITIPGAATSGPTGDTAGTGQTPGGGYGP